MVFWLDDEAIQAWYESAIPSSRARPLRYSDLAITTVLVIKRVFRLTLRAAQGFSGDVNVQGNTVVRWFTTLRDYDSQVAEAMAMVRALNKITKAGMPESVRIT